MNGLGILGVDPGKDGGLAFLGKRIQRAIPMPIIKRGKVTDVCVEWLIDWLSCCCDEGDNLEVAVVESVHSMPKQGVVSTFTFGKMYGQILGALAATGIPIINPTPQQWKKLVLAGTEKDKKAAIAFAQNRYPQIELVQPRCRTPHDGVADAICLAHYAKCLYPDEYGDE